MFYAKFVIRCLKIKSITYIDTNIILSRLHVDKVSLV